MMTLKFRNVGALCWALAALGVAGCSSSRVKPVALDGSAFPSLSPYKVVTVSPFTFDPKLGVDAATGLRMAEGVAQRLRTGFGAIFTQVRTGAPLGQDDELVILGTVTEYMAGTDGGSGGAFGVGAPRLEGVMRMEDGADTQDLAKGTFEQLRAFAGMSGMGGTLPELTAHTEAAIAFTVARAKGWRPAGSPPK